jgi:hypothetical protein
MVSPPWHNYRYHQNRPPSQENPKLNSWKIILASPRLNWRIDFFVIKPEAAHNITFYKNPCDIHLKPVFLAKLGLWRTPALKSHPISFRFFGYHNVARTVVILNISQSADICFLPGISAKNTSDSNHNILYSL